MASLYVLFIDSQVILIKGTQGLSQNLNHPEAHHVQGQPDALAADVDDINIPVIFKLLVYPI